MKAGRNAITEYMQMPSSRAVRFVVHTAGWRIICMSMRGAFARVSTRAQITPMMTASRKSPSVFHESQPQDEPWLMPSSSATSQPESSRAPGMLTVPAVRTGDSGTSSQVATAAATMMMPGMMNSQCQLRWETIGPATVIPRPLPTAMIEADSPMAPATFSRGNSSRMIPKARGRTPPPAPWIRRATISSAMELETAARAVPAASAPRVTTSIRSLPNTSPMRPRIGVNTEAESR